jgi:hypothetical protein
MRRPKNVNRRHVGARYALLVAALVLVLGVLAWAGPAFASLTKIANNSSTVAASERWVAWRDDDAYVTTYLDTSTGITGTVSPELTGNPAMAGDWLCATRHTLWGDHGYYRGELVARNLATGEVRVIAQEPPTGPVGNFDRMIIGGGSYMVWTSYTADPEPRNRVLKAYDFRTGVTRTIIEVPFMPPIGFGSTGGASIRGDLLLWSSEWEWNDDTNRFDSSVRVTNLLSGTTTTFTAHDVLFTARWYGDRILALGDLEGSGSDAGKALWGYDPNSGTRTKLYTGIAVPFASDDEQYGGPVVQGDWVVWRGTLDSAADTDWFYALNPISGVVKALGPDPGGAYTGSWCNYVANSNRVFIWASGTGSDQNFSIWQASAADGSPVLTPLLSKTPAADTVTLGGCYTIQGAEPWRFGAKLTIAGSPAAGRTVYLESSDDGINYDSQLLSRTANSLGDVSVWMPNDLGIRDAVLWHSAGTTWYRWRLSAVEGRSAGAITAGTKVTRVASASARTTQTKLAGPSSVRKNTTLKLTGTVAPAGPGTVKIAITRKVGNQWKGAGTAKVNVAGGKFSYHFKPKYKGSWRFVATYSGGTGGGSVYKSSKSGTKGVSVR